MKPVRVLGVAAAVVLLGLVACKKEEKPDAFVQAAFKAVEGQPQELWKALPASYQKDVNGLITAFAAKMPAQLWNDGFVTAQKIVKVLDTKREFIFAHPQISQMFKKEDLEKGWEPAVRTLSRFVNSDLKTLEGLQHLDVEKFLAGPVAAAVQDLVEAADVAAKAGPAQGAPDIGELKEKMKAAKVTVESVEGDTAKIKIEVEGEEPNVEEMVKVEGKWIPKKLADGWSQGIADAKKSIESFEIEQAMIAQFNGVKGMLDTVLDGMLAAKDQDEFNAQVASATEAFAGPGFGAAPAAAAPAEEATEEEPAPAEEKAAPAPKRGKKAKRGKRGKQ